MADLDRRAFLRLSGSAAGALAVAGCTRAATGPGQSGAPTSGAAESPAPAAVSVPTAPAPGAGAAKAIQGTANPGSASDQIQSLAGTWQLLPDPKNQGRDGRWYAEVQTGAKAAPVPGTMQQVFPGFFGVAWYWLAFEPRCLPDAQHKVLIHFYGSVDYLGEVWLNGSYLGSYEGGEGAFDLDASQAIVPSKTNLLAVRVLDPTDDPIDGYVLKQVPHRNKTMSPDPGSSSNYGGILQPVELRAVPLVRITDIFVRPDPQSGRVPVSISLTNATDKEVTCRLVATIGPAGGSENSAEAWVTSEIKLAPGAGAAEIELRVSQPRLWELYDPYLYRVNLRLEPLPAGQAPADEHNVRCGFREFRVDKGYFRLNGRRLFVRSAHIGNRFPFTQVFAGHPDQVRQDYVNAKAAGFNMVRFICGVPTAEQMDFFDELGLLVYEECYASWLLEDSPKLAERFDRSTDAMVLGGRNHPCVVIYGLLNETSYGPTFLHAKDYLPHLRRLDPTRLVLLGSGRFDGQLDTGSVSNPGSDHWEYEWGAEGINAGPQYHQGVAYPLAYYPGMGDVHFYPKVPQTPATDDLLRSLGQDTKPVFLSEYGIGSLANTVREARRFEELGSDAGALRSIADLLARDWQAWGMEQVYPFVEDLLSESQRAHNRQRLVGFNLIRANPHICGYSLTSMVDYTVGEGLWSFSGEWKPGIVDALTDGWAPLRWCLFTRPSHVYAGQSLLVEAVLANDGVLQPGSYAATFRIWGPSGPAWEKKIQVVVPAPAAGEDPPLAIPVLSEQIKLAGPAGTYQLAVSMEHAAPTGGRLAFFVSQAPARPARSSNVLGWGLSSAIKDWLRRHNVNVQTQAQAPATSRSVILVGPEMQAESDLAHWTALMSRVARGSVVVFLAPAAFQKSYQQLGWLPLADRKGFFTDFFDWLYHKECVAKAHPIFAGLQARGIMDWDYYGPVLNNHFFSGQKVADEVVAAAFAPGYPAPNGYMSGVMLGGYAFGAGRFFINAFRILENLGQHPAADRLLLNLIAHGQTLATGPAAPLPRDWDQTLKAIDYVPQ